MKHAHQGAPSTVSLSCTTIRIDITNTRRTESQIPSEHSHHRQGANAITHYCHYHQLIPVRSLPPLCVRQFHPLYSCWCEERCRVPGTQDTPQDCIRSVRIIASNKKHHNHDRTIQRECWQSRSPHTERESIAPCSHSQSNESHDCNHCERTTEHSSTTP